MRRVRRICGVLAFAVAACALLAAPALAGGGADHDVATRDTAPTLGAIDDTWDNASAFPVTFGSLTGDMKVLRTVDHLYIGIRVADPSTAPSTSAIYFDNTDNGVIDVGDNEVQFDGTTYLDQSAADSSFSLVPDATNDGSAAQSIDGAGTHIITYEIPLCGSDPTEDFCITPPSYLQSPVRLGFTVTYDGFKYPTDPANAAAFDNFVFEPPVDNSPPPTPHIDLTSTAAGQPTSYLTLNSDGFYTAWYNPNDNGSFVAAVFADDDPETGIASATFGSPAASGWSETPGSNAREAVYSWTKGSPPAPSVEVTSTNGAGASSNPRSLGFANDSNAPSGGITCIPSGCDNSNGPVLVTVNAQDAGGSGIDQLRYTTDGSDPTATTGTSIANGGTFAVTTPSTTVKLWGIDNVGNAQVMSASSVSGAADPTASNGLVYFQSTRPSASDLTQSHLFTVDPSTTTETPLASVPQGAQHVDVSRDGSMIAYTLNGTIFVADKNGNGAHSISTGNNDWPAISPDGTKIAYSHQTSNAHWDVVVDSINGQNAVDVTSSNSPLRDDLNPTWSPDGSQIAFGSAGQDSPSGPVLPSHVFTQAAVANADVTDLGVGQDPAWSPDGTAIAFDSLNNTIHTWAQVMVMGPEGQNPHVLTDSYAGFNDGGDQNSDPSWSPDGKKIAFVFSPGGGQNFDVYTMNADGSGRAPAFAAPNATYEGYPAWAPAPAAPSTPTNGRIVYDEMTPAVGGGTATDVFSANPDGTHVRQLTNQPGRDEGAQYSPDGTKIVWGSDGGNASGPMHIWVMNSDGTGATQLTPGSTSDSSPAYSPDGSQIAFARSNGGDSDIWVMNANGSNPHDITNTVENPESSPSWSPDGSLIAYARGPLGSEDIYVASADGSGTPLNLTDDPAIDNHDPSWSPDGSQIAYVASEDTSNGPTNLPQVLVMDANGANQHTISDVSSGANFSADPSWSPDGTKIAFSFSPGINGFDDFDIETMNADGMGVAHVTNNSVYDGFPNWGTEPLDTGGGGPSGSPSTTTSHPSLAVAAVGQVVTDVATVESGGISALPQGTVTFSVCGPLAVASGCPTGGTQVGDAQTIDGGGGPVTSNGFTSIKGGFYCFRADYSGDSQFLASSDGSAAECFQSVPQQQGPTFIVNTADDHHGCHRLHNRQLLAARGDRRGERDPRPRDDRLRDPHRQRDDPHESGPAQGDRPDHDRRHDPARRPRHSADHARRDGHRDNTSLQRRRPCPGGWLVDGARTCVRQLPGQRHRRRRRHRQRDHGQRDRCHGRRQGVASERRERHRRRRRDRHADHREPRLGERGRRDPRDRRLDRHAHSRQQDRHRRERRRSG